MGDNNSTSSCPSGALTCDTTSIYIATLDRTEFFTAFLKFGIPSIVCAFLGTLAFHRAQYKLRLLPSVVTLTTAKRWSDLTLEKVLAWVCLLIVIVSLLPSLFILLWGIYVYKNINHLLGFALFLLLMSFQMLGYSFQHWRINGWRLDRLIYIMFTLSITSMWTFEIWTIYLDKPFTYFMLSVVWISFNMIPMIILTYQVAQTWTKPIEGYRDLNTDPVEDYKKYLKEMVEEQQRRMTQLDILGVNMIGGTGGDGGDIKSGGIKGGGGGVNTETRVQPFSSYGSMQESDEEMKEQRINVQPAGGEAVAGTGEPALKHGIIDAPQYRWRAWQKILCYFSALLLLLAYSISVHVIKDSGGFANLIGWVTSGTIICLDLTVWLCVYSGKITAPLTACLYQLACRIILVLFGDTYWFIGHSVMYCVLAVFFGLSIVDHVLPKLTPLQQTASTVSSLLPSSSSSGDFDSSSSFSSSPSSIAAIKYSEQLSSGFILQAGSFAATRFGKSLLKYIEFYAFGMLTVAFLADLVINSRTSHVDIELTTTHRQYLAGILALFLTGIFLSTQFIYRMYYNRDYRIDWKLCATLMLQWFICIGCGIFLFVLTRSVILISCFCFLPPIVYLSTYGYVAWVFNDYQLYLDPTDEEAFAKAPGAGGRKRDSSVAQGGNIQVAGGLNPPPISPAQPISPSVPPVTGGREGGLGAGAAEEQKTATTGGTDSVTINVVPSIALTHEHAEPQPINARVPKMAIQEIEVDLGKYSYLRKYRIIIAWIIASLLTIGMGVTISIHSNPPYVGYSISAALIILFSTCIPIIEWFNSFQISKNMITQLTVTTIFFIAYILVFFLEGLKHQKNVSSAALLFVFFMYPTCVILIFAVMKWKDEKWVMSKFVKATLCICVALITTFLLIVSIVYDPFEIGASLLVFFYIILFGSFIVPILTRYFPHLIKWSVFIGCCILIAFAAGVGSQPNNGFIGFSIAWGILFCILTVLAYQSHRNTSRVNMISHLYSPNIFPVFSYDLTPGLRNPLKKDDRRVYLVFGSLFVSCIWGILAVFFLRTTWIGLGIHAVSIVLMIIYIYECKTQPRILLANSIRYLGEGSKKYLEAVKRAKMAAFRSQLTSIKSTSTSPDQQIQAVGKSGMGFGAGDDDHDEMKMPHRELSIVQEVARSSDDTLLLDEADLQLLKLDDPTRPLTELDWRGLYLIFSDLRSATPIPSLLAFRKGTEPVTVIHWRGLELPLRRCHELLLKLDHHMSELHSNFLSYQTQIQVELILGVQHLKLEQETEILQMLRDTGHGDLTLDYIRALKPRDPERVTLENALIAWKDQQAHIAQERQRKRHEEEIAARLREEEERRRVVEEEANRIHVRQDQQNVDAAAIRQKQEEQRQREEADRRRQEEDEQRRIASDQLEASRIARERAEQERKQKEEEIAARLIAEQNQKQLEILRAQQEAARITEEKRKEEERKTLELLAAEQATRDAEVAKERALQAKVATAITKHCCTINETGAIFVTQHWYQCITCNAPHEEGFCEVCRQICHAGHQIRDMGISPFYCDCGKAGCQASTGIKPNSKNIGGGGSTSNQLQEIESRYKQTGQKWTDPDFPPNHTALLRDPNSSKRPEWKDLIWRRPEEMKGISHPILFENGADPLDINQGAIGDCWFMSAISVMTQRQKDLMNIFVSKDHSPAGVYSVNFWKNGERVNILIDSNFPCTKQNTAAFGRSANANELWVMILEKAYAKMYSCLSFGTRVRVYDSPTPVVVESLKPGMRLLDENLQPVTVTKFATGVSERMIKIQYDGGAGEHLVTPDHLVTLRCRINPVCRIETSSEGHTIVNLQWQGRDGDDTDILPTLHTRTWQLGGTSHIHTTLPRAMQPYLEQFAMWWLSGLESRSKGCSRVLRIGDLFEVTASSLLHAPPQFFQDHAIPMAASLDENLTTHLSKTTSSVSSSSAATESQLTREFMLLNTLNPVAAFTSEPPPSLLDFNSDKQIRSIKLIPGNCNFVRLEVSGSGRFVLGDNTITHNCYESIESGFVDAALVDLSGGIGSRIDMSKDPGKKEARTGQLFQQLLSYRQSGFLLGAGSPAGSDSEANASPSGIIQGHAYAILDVQDIDGNQLIRLRNPWGRKEWTGDWSDNSDKWTRRLKAKLNFVAADDGAFWMCMMDFARHFEEVYVCRFFDPEKGWQQATEPIRGEWKGLTAGGCTNFDSVKDNPQYLLQINEPTNIVLNLSQTDTRGTSVKLKPIAIEVYNAKGLRVTRTRTGPLVCSNPDSYIYRREVSVEHEFQPQSEPYTLLISTFNPGEETQWALQIYSSAPIGFTLAPPYTGKKK